MRKIAVTGGLSCGKSTVCLFLKDLGAYVTSADTIVHELLSSDTEISKQVVHLLGPDIYTEGQIDRKKISEIVFSDQAKLEALEAILHPAVEKEIFRHYERVKDNSSYIFFAAEIPLLYEIGLEKLFDAVITVSADQDVALSRSHLHKKDFETRMNHQKTILEKQAKADFVIINNGDLATLKKTVANIIQQL